MFKLTFLVALIAISAFAYRIPSVQTGQDESIVWTGGGKHILQTGNAVGRSTTATMNFATKFSSYPQVLVTNYLLDWQNGQPSGYIIEVAAIGLDQFTAKVTATSARQLYSVFIAYLAFDDPKVQVGYVFSDQLGDLSKGGPSARTVTLKVAFSWPGVKPSSVVGNAYLVGISFTAGNERIQVNLNDITPDGANLAVVAWWDTWVTYLRVAYIVGDPSVLFAGAVTKNAGAIGNSATSIDIPAAFSAGGRGVAYGFTGYDCDQGINFRLRIQDFAARDNSKATANFVTWAGSTVYAAWWTVTVYKPNPADIIWDTKCAELFSECNFKGQSAILCDRNDSFPKSGWNGPVKSFNIPAGKTLKLYDQENLGGKVVTFTESQKCVDSLNFSFLQRVSVE